MHKVWVDFTVKLFLNFLNHFVSFGILNFTTKLVEIDFSVFMLISSDRKSVV